MLMLDLFKKLFSVNKFEATSKLIDGTEINIKGNVDTGTEVFVLTPDGEQPIPDGEYTLEDGTIINCLGGKITDIKQKDPNQAEPTDPEPSVTVEVDNAVEPTTPPTPETPQASGEIDTKVADLETKVSELTSKMDEIMKQLKMSEVKQVEFSKNIEMKLEKIDGAKPLKKNDIEVTDSTIKDPVARYIYETRNKK